MLKNLILSAAALGVLLACQPPPAAGGAGDNGNPAFKDALLEAKLAEDFHVFSSFAVLVSPWAGRWLCPLHGVRRGR